MENGMMKDVIPFFVFALSPIPFFYFCISKSYDDEKNSQYNYALRSYQHEGLCAERQTCSSASTITY
jgi:hypothetical protein